MPLPLIHGLFSDPFHYSRIVFYQLCKSIAILTLQPLDTLLLNCGLSLSASTISSLASTTSFLQNVAYTHFPGCQPCSSRLTNEGICGESGVVFHRTSFFCSWVIHGPAVNQPMSSIYPLPARVMFALFTALPAMLVVSGLFSVFCLCFSESQ